MVTLEVWRARIGAHHSRTSGRCITSCRLSDDNSIALATLYFVVLRVLLIIGNIELNPGPETYKCSFCQASFTSLGTHCSHQKVHLNVFNYLFECGDPSCFGQFSSFASLNSHISRIHKTQRDEVCIQDTESFLCSYCSVEKFSFSSVAALCKHLLKTHFTPGSCVTCPLVTECGRRNPFLSQSAFSTHLSKQHPGWQDLEPSSLYQSRNLASDSGPSDVIDYDAVPLFDQERDTDSNDEFFDAEDSFFYTQEDIFEFIARFYLMLEVNCFISVANIDKICQSLTILSEMTQVYMRETMSKELKTLNIDDGSICQVLSKLSSCDGLYLAHHKATLGPDFTSHYLRSKHFKQYFPTVTAEYPNFVPEDPIDGERYTYVSLKSSLSLLLQDSSVSKELIKSFDRNATAQSRDGIILEDYTDGEVCKKRNLPSKRIDLLIFQDAFSVTSMLTNVQNKYKTMGVYFSLGNFPPWLRTRLRGMHLNMLVLEKHCRTFRQACWSKLVAELKALQDTGVEFMGETIPVFVQFCIGDNLGSHFLGGFVESFTASHFCRYCEITLAEFRRDPCAVKPLRTQQRYELCALAMETSCATHNHGVKENSVFNDLDNFKICDPSLPPCIGHDLFHGIAEWDMRSIIDALIKKKWFTITLLIRRISSFKYSTDDSKNKPAPVSISKGKKKKKIGLGGSAVQNWKLIQLFPFIIQDLIKNCDDPHWRLYLQLKEICELICAPRIHEDQIDLLESLIVKYLRDRIVLGKARPKHQFVRHYPALIRKFGPLIHLWGMRFEQKHQFFKRVARTCNNFINILKTLVEKSQLLFAYESIGSRFQKVLQGNLMEISPAHFPDDVAAAVRSQALDESVKCSKNVTVNGLKYQQGDLLVLGTTLQQSGCLKVAYIEAILLKNSSALFVIRNHTASLNPQTGVHHLDCTQSFLTVIQQETLKYPSPQSTCSMILIVSL